MSKHTIFFACIGLLLTSTGVMAATPWEGGESVNGNLRLTTTAKHLKFGGTAKYVASCLCVPGHQITIKTSMDEKALTSAASKTGKVGEGVSHSYTAKTYFSYTGGVPEAANVVAECTCGNKASVPLAISGWVFYSTLSPNATENQATNTYVAKYLPEDEEPQNKTTLKFDSQMKLHLYMTGRANDIGVTCSGAAAITATACPQLVSQKEVPSVEVKIENAITLTKPRRNWVIKLTGVFKSLMAGGISYPDLTAGTDINVNKNNTFQAHGEAKVNNKSWSNEVEKNVKTITGTTQHINTKLIVPHGQRDTGTVEFQGTDARSEESARLFIP